ncbi:MAG: 1-acyl-sn-glycerol-3-phosphate acyltransferase [Clostridia bacterium]|nr:1-acyl-sn-glycerol-3-phosphate acyltransferase [Clostridia bacterium]
MSRSFFNGFIKATGWPAERILFTTKVCYEDKKVQSRKLKGPCIVVCNHTSIYDIVPLIFTFFTRTINFQTAEVLYDRKPLAGLLKAMGSVCVDRNAKNFDFIEETLEILYEGGVVGIFPEARLPLPEEKTLLEFKPSCVYTALAAAVPIVPVYTDGEYFKLTKRAHLIIGKPFDVFDFYDPAIPESENLRICSQALRERIMELGRLLDEKKAGS